MSLQDELGRLEQAKTEAESEAEVKRIEAEAKAYQDRAAVDFLWRKWPTLESKVIFRTRAVKVDRFGWLRRLWLRR